MQCSACQTENPENARFCLQCGAKIVTPPVKRPAERRQITVLFCDLVGSTALSEELDPEDLRDVISRYHTTCDTVVARYGGFVAQPLGDGVLAYFGHPQAHEDDAERAVRAGLDLLRSVEQMSVRNRPLAVRVGIHTGVVVVGAVGAAGRQLAIGATPNLAARVQQEAEPGTVLISEASQRLVSGLFHLEDLGLRNIRGVSQPVHLYRVEKHTGARSRMEAATTARLTPFVGREIELARVMQHWRETLEGKASVVFMSGEPGIGKSRLVRKLRERVRSEAVVVECYASPLFQDTALYPIVEMLERQIGTEKEAPSRRRARLRAQLEEASVATSMTIGPLETLLGIPPSDAESTSLSPQRQRQATFDALALWLRALTDKRPALFVIEDLHWADPSTLELIGVLIERLATGRLMMMLTHRPEFAPPYDSPRVAQLILQRMPQDEAQKILASLTNNKRLPEAVEREVLAKADGVPLYVEEIGKAVLESREPGTQEDATGPVSSRAGFAVPATVVDSLTARLDRLGEGKRVVQLAATLGRTFALGVLLEVAGMQESELRAELNRLQAAGLVFRQDAPPDEAYIFKHALIQDTAYASLLRGTRQEYHRQIASVLEQKFPGIAMSQPELLARHFEGAGMTAEAITHWSLAGQRAIARSANAEAINAFSNALNLLMTMPQSKKRDRQEIELRCGLGLVYLSSKGWSAPEVEETYGRAHDLCRRHGDVPFRVLYGLWAVYINRSDRERTTELVPRLEEALRRANDRQELLTIHSMLAGYAFWSANYSNAVQHSDAGVSYIAKDNPKKQASELFSQGYDGQLYPLIFKAWSEVIRGRTLTADALSKEYIDIAIASGHPFLLALALSCGAAVAHDMRAVELVEARGQKLLELASENGFSFLSGNALSFLGWASLKRGEHERGLQMLRQAADFHVAVGADMVSAYYLSWFAEACVDINRVDEGLAAVAQGLRITETKLSVFCEPELHRLKGDLLVLKGDVDGAESCLRTALALAQSKGAALFEARAALSLGRLWASQNRTPEVRSMLRTSLSRIADDELIRERRELLDLGKQFDETL